MSVIGNQLADPLMIVMQHLCNLLLFYYVKVFVMMNNQKINRLINNSDVVFDIDKKNNRYKKCVFYTIKSLKK